MHAVQEDGHQSSAWERGGASSLPGDMCVEGAPLRRLGASRLSGCVCVEGATGIPG
jgi:hypothetical protein